MFVRPGTVVHAVHAGKSLGTGIVGIRRTDGWSGKESVWPDRGPDGQASRAISTARLNMLPCLHLRPIDVVVSDGPSGSLRSGKIGLGGGFPLRCFQRFSCPDIATRRYPWRNSRYTSGRSVPVLSYYGRLPSIFLRPRRIQTELSHVVLNPAHVPI